MSRGNWFDASNYRHETLRYSEALFDSPCCGRRFGIVHVIIVSTSEESCKSVAVQIQGACCIWEDWELPPTNPMSRHGYGGHRLLMQTRSGLHTCRTWKIKHITSFLVYLRALPAPILLLRSRAAARTLRLRYNVMFLDTDLVIFDDPYK